MHIHHYILLLSIILIAALGPLTAADKPEAEGITKGKLLYESSMADAKSLEGWVMEGPGSLAFKDGWLQMASPDEKGHHVYWCPQDFPDRFVAEWEVQNQHPEAGLCIVFFAAKGLKGESIFDPKLPERDGTFAQYHSGKFNNYHISYYANAPFRKDRPHTHLRKNKGFKKVQAGEKGIAADSTAVHKIQLIKDGGHIRLLIDGRQVIDWTDPGKKGKKGKPALQDGKIGLRQMQWTRFRYRNFQVWELDE